MIISNIVSINWDALSSISTFAAVIVAIFLPVYNNIEKRKLIIKSIVKTDYDNSIIILCITIDNIGNRNIIIDRIGFKSINGIDVTYDYLLKDCELPLKIKTNDSELILFEYKHNGHIDIDNEDSVDVARVFKTKEIILFDSMNNRYS
ncbi:hypothetical protein [Macrococcoides caseolyticum]|uniref:hypothetical protein n=1 Tax=Macrococcoides caseolyticum TaxID=69966 RepID=UPI000C33ED54|nr:hypothetical protein [Macrococcus caseolyticus]PKD99717.1 hypothetical protein CW719_01630 [Macrococcus caseolyticus]PKF19805.1 hypothetical protein CW717_01630 [Macrococcus caseolyticus]